jgi:radical SAM superfamily enzyme YgiQ (UPF0313 family)
MNHGLIFNVTQNPFLSRPLGGHRIAHYLREQNWDIEVVDWANWWKLEQLQEFFKSRYTKKTVFVGFGHLFSMWPDMMEQFCLWIKINYPHIKLISGSAVNPMFTSKYIDYYIQGYGEYAATALLKYITSNGPPPIFNLLAPGGRKIISAIQSYPAFPMKSLMVKYQDRDFIQAKEWLTMEFSRGCIFSCAFCNFPVLGVKEDYSRTSEDFEIQIKDAYDRFGVSSYIVADETFNDRPDKIVKFADVVEKLNFSTWFSGYIRADLMVSRPLDREQLLRMNFLGHYYGIESFNTASARAVGKGMNSERLQQGLVDVKNYFETHGRNQYRGSMGLIAGLPHETPESLQSTVEWLINNWQGHSFSLAPLVIPTNNSINHESKISADLQKYGYRPMTVEEIDNYSGPRPQDLTNSFDKIIEPGLRKVVVDEVQWTNPNMNRFDAHIICNNIIKTKEKYDFRPSCHALAYRLTDTVEISDKLLLGFAEFDPQFDFSIENYINLKLNVKL